LSGITKGGTMNSNEPHPVEYDLVVAGTIGDRTLHALGDVQRVAIEASGTRLRGTFVDQPSLHGVIERIRDLGLVLVDVHKIP
jgi:hypothetical protein